MDLKNVALFLFSLTLLGDCSNAEKSFNKECLYKDSVNINCVYGMRDFYRSGNRLFPNPCFKDEEAFKIAKSTNVFSILEKSDSLYILSGENIFNVETNQNLPIINDSLIKAYYSKKFQIIHDTDPPKWTVLENKKDTIIMELVSQGYDNDGLLFAHITDTIFQLKNGLRIGIDKGRFFEILGIDFMYDKGDFTVLLTSMFESNASWYYSYYCSNSTDEIYCHPDGFNERTYFKYFLKFKKNKLVEIKIHS